MRPGGGFQGGKSNTFEMYKYVKLSGSNFSAHAWCNIHSIDCNRRFHGRGRHLGSGANAAKFTVNVWEKS